jgi:replication factor A1
MQKKTVGEYLAFLSVKYEVKPHKLFKALISAWKNHTANCGKLSITCRKKIRGGKAIFLLTNKGKVVAQFPISEKFLREKNPITQSQNTSLIRSYLAKKADRKRHSLNIRDLKKGMKQISLKAKVLEIPEPKRVFTRFGNYAAVTNALLTDKTGNIKLCLWNEQIKSISEGDIIHIENARLSFFRGEKQLRIGKNGRISVVEKENPYP